MAFPSPRSDTADDLVGRAREAVRAVEALLADGTYRVRERVTAEDSIMPRLLDREQRATHGLAWFATFVEALRQLAGYAERLQTDGRLGEIEKLIVRIGFGEFLAQILGGIPMSQGEFVRLADLGLSGAAVAARVTPNLEAMIADGNTAPLRARLIELMRDHPEPIIGNSGLDETLESIRAEMRKFSASEVAPRAQSWHLRNSYIPL